jgi:phospholipase/carboxylesterase
MRSVDLGFEYRFVPSRGGAPAPLMLLHGTGGNENDLLPLGEALAPGAALLSPRGKVLENGMPRFFRRLTEGVFDVRDVEARAHELADFVNAAREVHQLGETRPVAVGFSNGANIAAALLLLRPEALTGAILFRAMVPLEPPALPDLRGVRVFLGAGRRDPIASPAQTDRLAEMLGSAGADVSVHWVDAGHGLTAGDVEAAKTWLG